LGEATEDRGNAVLTRQFVRRRPEVLSGSPETVTLRMSRVRRDEQRGPRRDKPDPRRPNVGPYYGGARASRTGQGTARPNGQYRGRGPYIGPQRDGANSARARRTWSSRRRERHVRRVVCFPGVVADDVSAALVRAREATTRLGSDEKLLAAIPNNAYAAEGFLFLPCACIGTRRNGVTQGRVSGGGGRAR
jgi:hypothetical protein